MTLIKKYCIVIMIAFVLSMFMKPALCFLILGSLAFYAGIAAIIFLTNIEKKGIASTGNVLEYQSDDEGYKTPVIEFTTLNGELIKEQPYFYASSDLSKIKSYKDMIGQPVSIAYDPDDPKKFVIASEKEFSHVILILLILVGLFFIGLGICSLLGYIKIGW